MGGYTKTYRIMNCKRAVTFEYEAHHEKTCLRWFASRKAAKQPAQLQRLGYWHHEYNKYRYYTIEESKNKGTDLTGRMHRLISSSAPLLFTYSINRFSCDVAHIYKLL